MTERRIVTDAEAAEYRVLAKGLADAFGVEGEDWLTDLLDTREELKKALEAVERRRDRINDALGYEFVGEYIDRPLARLRGDA
jgi:hypothetical protein